MSIKEKYETLKKQLSAEASQEFSTCAAALFEKYPTLDSFGWEQYTPYFNDGEECVFRVQYDEDALSINGVSRFDREGEEDEIDIEIREEISIFIESVGKDILKNIFGDHVEVISHRDGSQTSSHCNHD